jgi:hypothetical protein
VQPQEISGSGWTNADRFAEKSVNVPRPRAAYLQFMGLTIILFGSELRSVSAEWLK